MKIYKHLQINTGKYSVYGNWDDTDTETEINTCTKPKDYGFTFILLGKEMRYIAKWKVDEPFDSKALIEV